MQLDPKRSSGKLAKWPGGLGQWGKALQGTVLFRSSFPSPASEDSGVLGSQERELSQQVPLALQEYLLAFWVPTIMRQTMSYCCQMAQKLPAWRSSPRPGRLSGGQLHRSSVKQEPSCSTQGYRHLAEADAYQAVWPRETCGGMSLGCSHPGG